MRQAEPDLDGLSDRLGYRFTDTALLLTALRHRSWCAEHPGQPSNERLEFLGDAVLGWVVADLAYTGNGQLAEGKLTDLRKAVVNAYALAGVARELRIGAEMLLGKGEDMAGGRDKPSILSDALEAIIGAVYVDGGIDAGFDFVRRLVAPRIADAIPRLDELDTKTALQELMVRLGMTSVGYVLRDEGPDHLKRFFAAVVANDTVLGEGEGSSKKQAEQAAAGDALRRLSTVEVAGLG